MVVSSRFFTILNISDVGKSQYIYIYMYTKLCTSVAILRGHSIVYTHHTSQWPTTSNGFPSQILSNRFCPILILEKEPVFPFQCWVLNKGTTGTIFITSLVWRGPWLGIEAGTSCTPSQHSTTRLSRRRCELYFKYPQIDKVPTV